MAPEHHIYLFIMLIIMPKGLSQLVKTQRVVIVTLGEDAHLSCCLMEPKDVLQVTWQKETLKGIENVASYNKRFGPLVNSRFQKVVFQDMGLQKCSIIIREVSREDEGCYKCLFNSNPDGAVIGRTCLQVNEPTLYEPTLLVTQSNDSNTLFSGLTVSCSATGRPAPIVAWKVTEHFLDSSAVNVNHPNGTVTVTITSTMAVPNVDTMVGCVVSSGEVIKEVSKEIPANSTSFTGMMVGVGVFSAGVIVFICGLVGWLFMRRHQKSRGKTGQDVPKITNSTSKSPIQHQEKDNGSVMIPLKQTTQQDEAEIRESLINEKPSGSVMTPCSSDVVEEGRVGKEGGSTVRKRMEKRFVDPETQCKKKLFK
ncbi:OX-2 membrane glycoprotein isoform X2 [Esox lucius]|uniref:Ig-like domain-containing protein n=1 Tax=Esox lucius TaxID=8010 RepID=A0A3P8XAB7_ESOLU|nr:OX-2 membrane glycoprotein isoform X2 [Esox lucius]